MRPPIPLNLRQAGSEWLQQLLQEKLGYRHIEGWQISMTLHEIAGRDIFVTVRTGGGNRCWYMHPSSSARLWGGSG